MSFNGIYCDGKSLTWDTAGRLLYTQEISAVVVNSWSLEPFHGQIPSIAKFYNPAFLFNSKITKSLKTLSYIINAWNPHVGLFSTSCLAIPV